MMIPAMANRICAITKGCATANPVLVAVAAEDHNSANKTPAPIHLYSCLIGKF